MRRVPSVIHQKIRHPFLPFQQQQQLRSVHRFLIVQWPSSEVTVRLDPSCSEEERNVFLNDIMQYSEAQLSHMNTSLVQESKQVKLKKRQTEFNVEQLKVIADKYAARDKGDEIDTFSCQLNMVSLIDRNQESKKPEANTTNE